jgi:lipopolysaccharide transport protein LptA
MIPLLSAALLVLAAATTPVADSNAIDITSDEMTLMPGTRLGVARGNVHAKSNTFDGTCDRGELTYGEAAHGKRSIELLVMHDHVKLRRLSDGLTADGDTATYSASTKDVVLTGSPVATRGNDILRGDEMTVALDENTLAVVEPRVELMRPNRTEPIRVRSETMAGSDQGKHLRFERRVQMRDGTMTATSDRLDVETENADNADGSRISRMVLVGHVVAHRGNQDAHAGRATYDGVTGDWLLTEKPIVTEDGNEIRGERILIDGASGRATALKASATVKGQP